MLNRIEGWIDAVFDRDWPWWLWPGLLAAMGTLAVFASLVFNPGPDHTVQLLGQPWGETCAFLKETGYPCPQCGMTRSWVHAARGHVFEAFQYNPAGATLWFWFVAGGLVGWVRILTKDPTRLQPPERLLAGWAIVWLVAIYALAYVLRIGFGVNPLPGA